MHLVDYLIFIVYFLAVLGVGVYFFRKNESREDYFVGGRSISSSHIGLSIVATDVGGGFSIGLGGLGFAMGLAGSWLLFTGLVGAWLAAVLTVPKVKKIDQKYGMLTFPDFLRFHFNERVALVAAVISGVGYLGFTSAQVLAGAKLAAGSVFAEVTSIDPLQLSLYIMAAVILIYTVLGGIKAVIYTDTIQWIILLGGLFLFGLPYAYFGVGGIEVLKNELPASYFSLLHIEISTFVNWFFTIVPIWFIAMTLYQRIYACSTVKEAKRSFFIAGLLEYPMMAFLGVILGMFARVAFPGVEAEMGMPMLLREVLPIGITGIVLSAYFSAIMSTADSCLIASSGNFVNDVVERYWMKNSTQKQTIRVSQIITLIVGSIALVIASGFTTVLEIILHAYSFMVAGLFVPTMIAYFSKHKSAGAALLSMFGGGGLTLILIFSKASLPFGLDASIYGIVFSALLYLLGVFIFPDKSRKTMYDTIEKMGHSLVQHGKQNDRIYLQKLDKKDFPEIIQKLEALASREKYSKIFVKVPQWAVETFADAGYKKEAMIPGFYNGKEKAVFMALFRDKKRSGLTSDKREEIEKNIMIATNKTGEGLQMPGSDGFEFRKLENRDVSELADVYKAVFDSYPFPIFEEEYLRETMADHVDYFGAFRDGRLVAASSAEMDSASQNAEMTDFATLPAFRGNKLALYLLDIMESEMKNKDMKTLYTIARSHSPGMNITFAKKGYVFGGTLVNNTDISGRIESMNVWFKLLKMERQKE